MELYELRQSPHLSASSIGDYIECGLLYKLGRVDKIPVEYKSDNMEFGSVIHLVLDEYYTGKMIGTKLTLKQLQDCFEAHWTDRMEGRDDIEYSKGKDFKVLLLLGKELLSAWYHSLPDDNFSVISVEEAFSVELPGIEIPVIGAMDLIEEDEAGTIIITDWKTSARSFHFDEVDNNMQLLLYQIAAKYSGYEDREILKKFGAAVFTCEIPGGARFRISVYKRGTGIVLTARALSYKPI